MGFWPFSRRKKKPRRAPPAHHSDRARARAEALRQARGKKHRPKTTYVPPPTPSHPSLVPQRYRAPDGPQVWQWLKTAPADYFVEAWSEQDPDGYEDFSRWPLADPPRGIHSIRKSTLDVILEAGKSAYPQEFGGMLRVEDGVIEELILLPGTQSGDTAAIFQMHMLPVDFSIVGTVHSHPSPIPFPSAADTNLFERHGRIHIITGYPYGPRDWNAFDHRSRKVRLRVVD